MTLSFFNSGYILDLLTVRHQLFNNFTFLTQPAGYKMLICTFFGCWMVDFVSFGQIQAVSFLFLVFVLYLLDKLPAFCLTDSNESFDCSSSHPQILKCPNCSFKQRNIWRLC